MKLVADNKKLTMNDFNVETVLGKGAFGKVLLVTYKKNNERFALKMVEKKKKIC